MFSTDGISPTLCVGGDPPIIVVKNPNCEAEQTMKINNIESEYRIRKITETESLRLMGVSEEDIAKICGAVSATQAYKQAGNSIVVEVMVAIFDSLFNGSTAGQMTIFDYL